MARELFALSTHDVRFLHKVLERIYNDPDYKDRWVVTNAQIKAAKRVAGRIQSWQNKLAR